MQRPFLDARLDRRRREPVLCRHRPGRRLRVAQPPARRLHRCGLARNPGHADKTGACGAVLPCRDRLLLPMRHRTALFTLSVAALLLGACARKPPYTVYVSNEASGDLTVIDPVKLESTTIPIGKRARGIHVTPDGKYIYIALSGSRSLLPESTKAPCRHRIKAPTESASSISPPPGSCARCPAAAIPSSSPSRPMASCSTSRTKMPPASASSTPRTARS